MIIKTRRSHIALAFDTALTAVGWLGLFYIFTQGVLNQLQPIYAIGGAAARLNVLMPTINSLLIYLAITLFNAAALITWARYHKVIFKGLVNDQIAIIEDHSDAEAGLFSIMPYQLHDVRDSRVTVIHHSEDGGITHLETKHTQIPNAKSNVIYLDTAAA